MKKQILLIGIGQLGSSVADLFAQTAQKEGLPAHVLAVDTDCRSQESISHAQKVSMAHMCKLSDVLTALDTEILKAWFPCRSESDCVEYFENLSMSEGSNQWRMKALLAFDYFLSQPRGIELLQKTLEKLIPDSESVSECEIDICTVASLAGGTGSGLFLPLTLYIKRYLKEHGITRINTSAVLALPDICEELLTPEQRVKARANAYASLRELNAVTLTAVGKESAFSMKIGSADDPYMGLLYDSESNEFRSPENKPFGKIYLFRRVPGVQSITPHVEILADAARAICTEDTLSPLNTTDAIYGGFSLSKTVYPRDCIASYISLRYLYDTARSRWLPVYESASKELARMRAASLLGSAKFSGSAKDIVSAVLRDNRSDADGESRSRGKGKDDAAVVGSTEFSENARFIVSAVLRDYCLGTDRDGKSNGEEDALLSASGASELEDYLALLLEDIDSELLTGGITELEDYVDQQEKATEDKKARALKGKKLREKIIEDARLASEWLEEYYDHGTALTND